MSSENGPDRTRTLVILVADDDPVSRMVVASMLKREGHEVDTAIDGLEAVEAAARRRYDLVLMDLQMPELDGLEASRRIRGAGDPLPRIVALTATVDEEVRRRCREAGIDDVAEKPLDARRVAAIVAGTQLANETGPRSSAGEEAPTDLSATIFDRFRDEVSSHLARPVAVVVEEILATMRSQLRSLRDAFIRDDREELARIAHTLRGSASTIGATLLAERAAELERTASTLGRDAVEAAVSALEEHLARSAERIGNELGRPLQATGASSGNDKLSG
jgi:CheY-like chemotaxis protein